MKFSKEKLYQIADYYLSLGWSLLPMKMVWDHGHKVKKPMVQWKKYQDEQPTKAEVHEWIDSGFGLGLITGSLSGIDVVDDDRGKHGMDEWGFESSVVAKTASGGKHYYYQHKPGVRNKSNEEIHLDIRGEGGYVVLPPFFDYTWESKPTQGNIDLLETITDEDYELIGGPKEDGDYTPVTWKDLVSVDEGGRDNSLYKAALRLCNSTPERDWPTLLPILRDINATYKPPLSDKIVVEKLNQAMRFVKNNPIDKRAEKEAKVVARENKTKKYSQMTDDQIEEVKRRPTLPVNVPKLDNFFNFPSGYYVICANPGAGKGWFSLWLTRQFWTHHKQKSVIFSLEMPEHLIRMRLKQAWSDLTQEQFESGYSTAPAVELMKKDVVVVDEFYSDDQSLQTPEVFRELLEKYYKEGYRIFHFDHLHELDGANDNNRNQGVTEKWAKTFQQICKDHEDIWLFVFAQPNGAAATKPVISRTDIAGSKAITQKCEYFISLNRKTEKDEKGMLIFDNDDREVIFWLDKSRYTTISQSGRILYFDKTGNFYGSEEEARMSRRDQNPLEKLVIDMLY